MTPCKCQAQYVKSDTICTPGNHWNSKFDRLATVKDAKETQTFWKNKLSKWTIVGLNGGVAEGPGYGGQIKDFGVENTQPECGKYGEFLMCLHCATSGERQTVQLQCSKK